MNEDIVNCKNCASPVAGKYCANCGRLQSLKRVDGHYVAHEIQHVLHFEKGFLYTIRGLLTRPGASVKEFISDDRERLVKPVIFLIITSLIYSTVTHLLHIEDGYVKYGGSVDSATTKIFSWIEGHYGYANIIMGVFIALWIKLFFRKSGYNFFEILILLCFVMGMGMLIFAVFTIAHALLKIDLMQVAAFVGIAYCTWAIAQFFNARQASSYFKSLIAYLLGMLSFMVAALFLGLIINALLKH